MIGAYPTQREANVPASRQAARAARTDGPRRTSSRSKRDGILATATAYFGEHGYEDTKWADVAKAVGIGSTALYHYFESKLHCLYVIMADTLEARLAQFEADTREVSDYPATLERVLRGGFELSD